MYIIRPAGVNDHGHSHDLGRRRSESTRCPATPEMGSFRHTTRQFLEEAGIVYTELALAMVDDSATAIRQLASITRRDRTPKVV